MQQPLLSIVTPSLQQGRYIGQCLESVAREMATPLARQLGVEHVVMDGGSTDETVPLLEAARHLAYWQSAPDEGQSNAINQGLLNHSSGRYATWLNADDWYEAGALEPMLRRLAEPDPPDVLVGRCRFVEHDTTIFSPSPPEPISMSNLLRLRSQWFAGRLIVQPEAFFRRELFQRLGGLNEANHYSMDHELWLALLEAGARFESINHPVACMRVHEAQKTANNKAIVRSLIRFARPYLERHRDACDPEAEREIEAMDRKLALCERVLQHLSPALEAATAQSSSSPAARPLAPGPVEFHLAPLRAVLAEQAIPGGRFRKPRARIIGQAPDQLPVRMQPAASGPVDLVVFWNALAWTQNPAALVREATSDLRPGGVVIVAAELARCQAGLREYTKGLVRLMDRQLSEDHDWLIDPAVMPWVRSLEDAASDEGDLQQASWSYLAGTDLADIMQACGLRPCAGLAYGGMSWHPLTPFAAVEDVPGRNIDAWRCGVWTKR